MIRLKNLLNEVSDSEIKKSIKKKERGGPYTIIARNGQKIVAHSPKSYDKVEDAIKMYHKLNKKHGIRSSVSIEDGYGRTVFMESVNESVLNERADESLTDKEQELVRKSLQRAAGVKVSTDVTDLRYNTGTSEFIFDGGEEMMLYVGYDEDDEEYNVSIESFGDGQIAQKNTKDLKSAIKVAMQMAKKYKKRLTSESVNEAPPKMKKSKEVQNIEKTMAIVSGLQKGGMASRYGNDFLKAKRRALKAINDMLTYAKIGV